MGSLCSECGLEFDCGHVMSPILLGPDWSYEHSYVRSGRRWWATSLVALRPGWLCRKLRVDHRIRSGRLIRFGLLWLLVVHLFTFSIAFGSATITGTGFLMRYRPGGLSFRDLEDSDLWGHVIPILLFPYTSFLSIPTGASSSMRVPLEQIYLVLFGPLFLMPLWMLLLGTSLRRARVRKTHLLRGLCLSLPGGAVWIGVTVGVIAIAGIFRNTLDLDPSVVALGLLVTWLAYHMRWWFAFIQRYLRLRHAAAIVILNTVMSALTVLLLMVGLSLFRIGS